MKRALLWCFAALVFAVQASAQDKINLLLGEQKTLEVRGVTKVAVGDGTILSVNVVSPNELLLSGLTSGLTTLTTWSGQGQKETVTVQVFAQDPEQVRQAVESLLQVDGTPIEGVRARVVGDRVIIDGQVIKDEDQKRVEEVAKLYANVVNLTSFNRSFNLMKPMVQLDFQFYEIRKDDLTQFGINWADIVEPIGGAIMSAQYAKPIKPSGDPTASIALANDFNPIKMRSTYGGARLLQQHNLVVRNAEPAHYVEGGTLYIVAVGGSGGQAEIKEVEFGFIVDVTPEVDKAGNVVMKIAQSFKVPDRAQLIAGFPTFETRGIDTTVNLQLGQTVMLSGFITEEITKQAVGWPGLSKMPVLGALFGAQGSGKTQTDGVIFITPTLVKGVGNPGEDPFIRGIVDRYQNGGQAHADGATQ